MEQLLDFIAQGGLIALYVVTYGLKQPLELGLGSRTKQITLCVGILLLIYVFIW